MPNHHKNQRRREAEEKKQEHSEAEEKKQDLSRMNIKQEYYIEAEREFRKKWEREFGLYPEDKSLGHFTTEEQIDRYYINLCFWARECNNDTFPNSGKEAAKFFLASNHRMEIYNKIKSLPKDIKEGICQKMKINNLSK